MTNDWEGWWARKKVRIICSYLGGFAENGSDQEGCDERYKEQEGVALDITNGGNHGQNFLTTSEYVIVYFFLQIIVVAFQLMSYFLLLKYLLFTVLIVVYLFWLVLTL